MFVGPAVAGLIHAAASLYWTLGGAWLLDTIGEFAVEMQRRGGVEVRLMLGAITAVKVAGAIVPLLDHRHPPAHRWVRVVSWIGVGVMAVWGGAGMIGAGLALSGGAPWSAALIGHAFLWDPLFVLWAALLAVGLLRSRPWALQGRSSSRAANFP